MLWRFLILAALSLLVRAANDTHDGLLCTNYGACEPCRPAELHEPYCQPFGNKRLMHCVNATASSSSSTDSTESTSTPLPNPAQPPSHDPSEPHPEGEILAWQSCGRIVEKETADFYEFFAFNAVLAGLAIVVVLFRSRRLQMMHARQLAARIGLIRTEGPGGTGNFRGRL